MDDKVKKLVEWVATGIGVDICAKCGITGEECRTCNKLDGATNFAKQILSHPDLALLESCECGGNGYEEGGDGAPSWHVVCGKCVDTGRKVIPLAEALKETSK